MAEETAEERIARVRERMKSRLFTIADFGDFEIPPCEKCGRVIACGVNALCQDGDCPLKEKLK